MNFVKHDLGRRGAMWLLLAWCMSPIFSGDWALGQPQAQGIEIIKEGIIDESAPPGTFGNIILEPLQFSAAVGLAAGGSPWLELGAGVGLWWGDIHVSSSAELRGVSFSVDVDAEMQLEKLGLSASMSFSGLGVQLSGGVHTTWQNFTLAARMAAGAGSLSALGSATTKLGDLSVHVGASWVGNEPSASAGATWSMLEELVKLSVTASPNKAGFAVSGGADLVFSSEVSLSANASVDTNGLTMTLIGQTNFEAYSVSIQGAWGTQASGLSADLRLALGPVVLFGTWRVDEDSFSSDIGASMQWGIFTSKLTIGLDQGGFKWIQLNVKGEFNPFSWFPG